MESSQQQPAKIKIHDYIDYYRNIQPHNKKILGQTYQKKMVDAFIFEKLKRRGITQFQKTQKEKAEIRTFSEAIKAMAENDMTIPEKNKIFADIFNLEFTRILKEKESEKDEEKKMKDGDRVIISKKAVNIWNQIVDGVLPKDAFMEVFDSEKEDKKKPKQDLIMQINKAVPQQDYVPKNNDEYYEEKPDIVKNAQLAEIADLEQKAKVFIEEQRILAEKIKQAAEKKTVKTIQTQSFQSASGEEGVIDVQASDLQQINEEILEEEKKQEDEFGDFFANMTRVESEEQQKLEEERKLRLEADIWVQQVLDKVLPRMYDEILQESAKQFQELQELNQLTEEKAEEALSRIIKKIVNETIYQQLDLSFQEKEQIQDVVEIIAEDFRKSLLEQIEESGQIPMFQGIQNQPIVAEYGEEGPEQQIEEQPIVIEYGEEESVQQELEEQPIQQEEQQEDVYYDLYQQQDVKFQPQQVTPNLLDIIANKNKPQYTEKQKQYYNLNRQIQRNNDFDNFNKPKVLTLFQYDSNKIFMAQQQQQKMKIKIPQCC